MNIMPSQQNEVLETVDSDNKNLKEVLVDKIEVSQQKYNVQEPEIIITAIENSDENISLSSGNVDSRNETPSPLVHNHFMTNNDESDVALGKKKLSTSDPENWERNIIKKCRYNCLPYATKNGIMPGKHPKPVNCNCRFKCNTIFSEEERVAICQEFWNLADYKRQKDFILKFVKQTEPARKKRGVLPEKRRSCSRSYHFPKNHKETRVCQSFFEKTLCISNRPVSNAFLEACDGVFTGIDKRGRKAPHNKTKAEYLLFVKSHIESFPLVEPPCRKFTNRKYLDPKLSVKKMYEFYLDKCIENRRNPVSSTVYRNVFCREYNLSFFVPCKNPCMFCNKHTSLKTTDEMTSEINEQRICHLKKKNDAQATEDLNKIGSNDDSEIVSVIGLTKCSSSSIGK